MALAIFDLDNTLLAGDSDFLWGQFLVKKGLVDKRNYEQENQRYYDEYKAGNLDIYEFLAFSLKPLTMHSKCLLEDLREEFIREEIKSILLPKAFALIEEHSNKGDVLMIITATNRFVTEPIAKLLGVEHLLATEPEMINGQYTGKVAGTPCFQEGKVARLEEWLASKKRSLQDSWFYSDSHNDLPLLKRVSHPVAVDADDQLTAHAKAKQWRMISLR
ncbi:MAG TPA: HAD family hydrolase [Gammaproteobacteria bacterium]|nr:HAD family hydrolase [Gammaproteobacteria bacterium]